MLLLAPTMLMLWKSISNSTCDERGVPSPLEASPFEHWTFVEQMFNESPVRHLGGCICEANRDAQSVGFLLKMSFIISFIGGCLFSSIFFITHLSAESLSSCGGSLANIIMCGELNSLYPPSYLEL